MNQPGPPPFPPQASAPSGPPGRLIAAFAGGTVVTTIAAFVVLFISYVLSSNLAQIWGFYGLRLVGAVGLGLVMAIAFVVAKAQGPIAPIAAAVGGLIAERVGWLLGDAVMELGQQSLEVRFGASIQYADVYRLLNWAAILAVPLAAGALTALMTLRNAKATPSAPAPGAPLPPPPPPPYPGPGVPPQQQAGPDGPSQQPGVPPHAGT
ncbi:hypothetical protein [Actinomadura rupiterrae]|uniref:hypothetical protein n=1 Tax=Actinomadura rupiterrae TaxID=559627 RepID=UPI0020A52C09|nr:hypothetical protein [Actinomadura rupiterrae]MCP2336214.1 hypothetical protein [Actinomadura rupiterrae]